MDRTIYNIILVTIAICAVFGGAFALYSYLTLSSDPQEQNTSTGQTSVTPRSGGIGTGGPVGLSKTDVQLVEEVRATFREQQSDGEMELRATSVVGAYALQVWTDGVTGGQTLLRFDNTQNRWVTVAVTGGAFSVAGLHKQGVPQKTILALLHGLNK